MATTDNDNDGDDATAQQATAQRDTMTTTMATGDDGDNRR